MLTSRCLGIMLDSIFSFPSHVDKVVKKLEAECGFYQSYKRSSSSIITISNRSHKIMSWFMAFDLSQRCFSYAKCKKKILKPIHFKIKRYFCLTSSKRIMCSVSFNYELLEFVSRSIKGNRCEQYLISIFEFDEINWSRRISNQRILTQKLCKTKIQRNSILDR